MLNGFNSQQASSEGHTKAVEFLINCRAIINIRDRSEPFSIKPPHFHVETGFICFENCRWGGTPLQDAVKAGHMQVAKVLKSNGGIVPEVDGAIQICNAAANGDIQTLKLLIECAGIQVNANNQTIVCNALFGIEIVICFDCL